MLILMLMYQQSRHFTALLMELGRSKVLRRSLYSSIDCSADFSKGEDCRFKWRYCVLGLQGSFSWLNTRQFPPVPIHVINPA